MRNIILFVVLVFLLTGCVSSYLKDRMHDIADITTFCCGVGVGAKSRVGPIQIGALANADVVGLRGGEIFFQGLEIDAESLPCIFEASLYGTDIYDGADTVDYLSISKTSAHRGKNFSASGKWGVNTADPSYYYWQFEVLLAIGPSIRIGINLAEFVDFMLGIICIDMLNDDVMDASRRHREEQRLSGSEHQEKCKDKF